MMNKILYIFLFSSVLWACSTQHVHVEERKVIQPVCGGNFDEDISLKHGRPISIFEPNMIIKENDTVYVREILCADSTRFIKALVDLDLKVPEICIALNAQGNMYYSVFIDGSGHLENFKVVKKAHSCFDSFDKQLERRLTEIQIQSPDYYNSELIFSHKFRID